MYPFLLNLSLKPHNSLIAPSRIQMYLCNKEGIIADILQLEKRYIARGRVCGIVVFSCKVLYALLFLPLCLGAKNGQINLEIRVILILKASNKGSDLLTIFVYSRDQMAGKNSSWPFLELNLSLAVKTELSLCKAWLFFCQNHFKVCLSLHGLRYTYICTELNLALPIFE